jgi:Sulfotransferase family
MSNPFVFIVGSPRSGTTLLQRIVDAHPLIAITPETHWIARYYVRRRGLTRDGFATRKLIRKLLAYHKFPRLRIRRKQLKKLLGDSGESVPYARFVTGIFDLYGQKQRKPLVGDKTPGYAREIDILHELWPGAKFVHLIRDGRDVCLSALAWSAPCKLLSTFPTWQEDPLATAALWWEWHVRLGRQAGKALGPALYHEVRYESLVARPAADCERLCDFLGVPYDPGMLRFHERKRRKDQRDHPWTPISSGHRDWRSQMPMPDVERFETACGALLDELGYPRGAARLSCDNSGQITRLRQRVSRNLCERGFRLPEEWPITSGEVLC